MTGKERWLLSVKYLHTAKYKNSPAGNDPAGEFFAAKNNLN